MGELRHTAVPDLARLLAVLVLASAYAAGCGNQATGFTATATDGIQGVDEERTHFTSGIGFYWASEGWARPFTFTQEFPRGATGDDLNLPELPPDARFYSYGIDFSHPGGALQTGVVPHLSGFGFSFRDEEGEIRGRWAARFIPVEGYPQPTYEIIFEGLADSVRSGAVPYQYAAFQVSNGEAYLFRFAGADYLERRQEFRMGLFDALRDDEAEHTGNLSRPFRGSNETEEFTIRFDSFDHDDGDVEAEVLFGEEELRLTGRLTGLRTLRLQEEGGAVWDLRIPGLGFVSGSREESGGRATVYFSLQQEKEEEEPGEG